MEQITVYHGDNGVQEFWESGGRASNSQLLILRNHRDKQLVWIPYIKGNVLTDEERQKKAPPGHHYVIAGSLGEVLKKLKRQEGITVVFDRSKQFIRNPKKKRGMSMLLRRVN